MSGCGGAALNWEKETPATYVVRKGDTLYGIAWRYGLDYRDLARWNGLGSGSFIRVGQVIHLSAPAQTNRTVAASGPPRTAPATQGSAPRAASRPPPTSPRPVIVEPSDPPPVWRWPVESRIVAEYGSDGGPRTGALFEGKLRDPIYAAADGKVVYSGSGLIGYGKLIIVKHNESFLSAYGHNAELLVQEGDSVTRGQRIASMGEGPGRQPRLHFEIRYNGNPVNPRQYLPGK